MALKVAPKREERISFMQRTNSNGGVAPSPPPKLYPTCVFIKISTGRRSRSLPCRLHPSHGLAALARRHNLLKRCLSCTKLNLMHLPGTFHSLPPPTLPVLRIALLGHTNNSISIFHGGNRNVNDIHRVILVFSATF